MYSDHSDKCETTCSEMVAPDSNEPEITTQQGASTAIVASSLLGVVPSVCCSREVNMEAAIEKYNDDLPSPELISTELRRWKARYCEMAEELRPSTPAAAIKDCDLYPNIRVLLQVACTLPVTSCECERSASALRRLHNYMRAYMGMSRLSSLALLHIYYDMDVDFDEVVTRYAHLHPRKLELDSLEIEH